MPLIQFPDVPDVLGVPNVLRSTSANLNETNILSAIYSGNPLSIIDSILKPTWGIFTADGTGRVITPDSVIGFEYRGEAKIMDYPIEFGGFSTYNKVQVPFDIRMRMVCGGNIATSEMTRMSFLQRLEDMKASLDLYQLITPDFVYPSVNLVHFDYSRTAVNGVSLLMVEASFQEVRVTGEATYTNTKSDSSTGTVSQGNVVPSIPSKTQMSAASAGTN